MSSLSKYVRDILDLEKGDVDGHPFRGNQWVEGGASGVVRDLNRASKTGDGADAAAKRAFTVIDGLKRIVRTLPYGSAHQWVNQAHNDLASYDRHVATANFSAAHQMLRATANSISRAVTHLKGGTGTGRKK